MKLEFLAFCFVVILTLVNGNVDKNMLKVEGEGDETDSINDIIKNMGVGKFKNSDIDDSELSGDPYGTDVESGSGSGEIEPTETATTGKKEETSVVVDITLVPSTAETTTMENCVECVNVDDPDDDKNNVGDKDKQGAKDSKNGKSGVNFTVGIIIGVVVGAILAILIIVFLVYRLRKKDEGSYSLDEQSSTAYLRGETDKEKGKEYFA